MSDIKAIIIDDEWKAREALSKLINRHCPEVEIVAICENLVEGKVAILERVPDLVFLDIKMPEDNGFDLLRDVPNRQFKVIFVTAYPNFALEAFDEGAIDYLLKPIHSERLIKAIARFKSHGEVISKAPTPAPPVTVPLGKVGLPTEDGLEFFEAEDIYRFRAKGTHTLMYLASGECLNIARNLKKIEDAVAHLGFFRVQNAHLVNLNYIKKIKKIDGGFVVLQDGTEIEVSRRKKTKLLKIFQENQ